LNATPALSKFLVLLALFLLASHVHAFTSLSLVAGDQVGVNHLIRLQQLMSKPTNEPSREPIRKPTKRMDLDATLPNNLLPTKTRVAYSEPKQDAELPIKVTDLTNTQTPELCHDKKSELGLLKQPVQYDKEIIRSSPAVDAFSQQALHSFQYANINHKGQFTGST
jgi:hypothetical protein